MTKQPIEQPKDPWTTIAIRGDTHDRLETKKRVIKSKRFESFDDVIRREMNMPDIDASEGDAE